MPVFTTLPVDPDRPWGERRRTGETSHEGCVLEISHHEVRVMSDVWSTGTYALVWDSKKGEPDSILLYVSEFGGKYEAVVDASPEVRAAYQAYLEKQDQLDRARKVAASEEACRKELLLPVVGMPARVVRGRKVPVGTEGIVVYKGDGSYGERVGIKDSAGAIHYTASSNVERIVIRLEGEMWLDASLRLRVAPPMLRSRVRIVSGPDAEKSGVLFYVNGARCGVATSDRKVGGRYVDVVWTDVGRLMVEEGRETTFVNDDPPPPSAEAEVPF